MTLYFSGLILGVAVFIIIGLFHPLVIKAEYYLGRKSWWIFLFLGLITCGSSLFIGNILISSIFAVFGAACFWSIKEIFEQEKRVERGLFPQNPKRRYKC